MYTRRSIEPLNLRDLNPRDLNRRNQAVSALRYGLDDARLFGIIFEDASQLRDRSLENVVGNERLRPDGLKQFLFGDGFSGVFSQAYQNPHRLQRETHGGAVAGDSVKTGLD